MPSKRVCCKIGSQRTRGQKVFLLPFAPAFVCASCYSVEIARHLDAAKLTLTPRSAPNVDDPAVFCGYATVISERCVFSRPHFPEGLLQHDFLRLCNILCLTAGRPVRAVRAVLASIPAGRHWPSLHQFRSLSAERERFSICADKRIPTFISCIRSHFSVFALVLPF